MGKQGKTVSADVPVTNAADIGQGAGGRAVPDIGLGPVIGEGFVIQRVAEVVGAEYVIDFLPKIKIEIGVNEDLLDRAIEAISTSANTGNIGDGKIFVTNLEQVIRIRTGETGSAAL